MKLSPKMQAEVDAIAEAEIARVHDPRVFDRFRATLPELDAQGGAAGIRARVEACTDTDARDSYARALRPGGLRECATGRGMRDGVPLRACAWWVNVALGFLVGVMVGLVCGAGAVHPWH